MSIEVLSEFTAKYKDVYKYDMLGGNHTLVAKTQLMTKHPDNPFFRTVIEVNVGSPTVPRLVTTY